MFESDYLPTVVFVVNLQNTSLDVLLFELIMHLWKFYDKEDYLIYASFTTSWQLADTVFHIVNRKGVDYKDSCKCPARKASLSLKIGNFLAEQTKCWEKQLKPSWTLKKGMTNLRVVNTSSTPIFLAAVFQILACHTLTDRRSINLFLSHCYVWFFLVP